MHNFCLFFFQFYAFVNGYVMIFCYQTLDIPIHNRYIYMAFYMLFNLENAVLFALWATFGSAGGWVRVAGLAAPPALFVLHLAAMVRAHTHTHTHTNTHTHTYIHPYIHTNIQTYLNLKYTLDIETHSVTYMQTHAQTHIHRQII